MLNLLVKYTYDHNLAPEPGFARKFVRWAVACDSDGRFLEVIKLGDTSQRRNPGLAFPKCPDLPSFVVAAGDKGERRSHFLIESAHVVALYGLEPGDAKAESKHRYFVRLLQEASTTMPEIGAACRLLQDEESLAEIRAAFEAQKAQPTDSTTVNVAGTFPLESDAWHEWWCAFRAGLTAGKQSKDVMRCFATGDLRPPLLRQPKIRRLGGQPAGDALISFDKAAFRSYGLEASANAAVSEEAAAAYSAALNDLVANRSRSLAGVPLVHWFARDIPREDDPLAWLQPTDEQQELTAQVRAEKLIQSIRTGERADLASNHYYALTLSGMSGRIMVRDWMEGQFEDLVESVSAWFSDLQITSLNGDTPATDPSIERVITALLPEQKQGQAYGDWIKQIGAERTHLWRAALNKNLPIPFSALARVVTLNARFHQTGELEQAAESGRSGAAISALYARMGLMKAYHLRKKRESYLMPYLNEEHPDPAYHCGRLMAVYAALQRSAQGDVGAGVVQRHYAAASATPGLILGRLSRLSMFHLNKLNTGIARWYEGKLAVIWARIADRPPTTLTLEEQSLFALGYYQQMAADRKRKPTTDDQNTEAKEA
jgi:CRISPR-associated protein Csd1